jgi:SAM-dependent methyltransferase
MLTNKTTTHAKRESPLCYDRTPVGSIAAGDIEMASFVREDSANIDWTTVESFGEEWTKFSKFSDKDVDDVGNDYFDIVDESMLNSESVALDVGCGTGRWTRFIQSRCKFVEAIDPSKAVVAASAMLNGFDNVRITHADVDNIPFKDESFDFVFSLGVLHHIPDTAAAMQKCVEKVKVGGHFLVYLYYNLDNMGFIPKVIFFLMNSIRRIVCKMPPQLKKLSCDLLAVLIYLPNAIATWVLKLALGGETYKKIPLAYYHDKSFNVMRNDALDRFGTPLEQRFSKAKIVAMMESCGLGEVRVSAERPYWHAVGKKIR